MACRGVHFAITEEEVQRIRAFEKNKDRENYIGHVIENEYFTHQPQRKAESDKAWDAMHRALADADLSYTEGEYPLNHVIMGGEPLHSDPNYVIVLKTPTQVRDVAAALPAVSKHVLRRKYDNIDEESYDSPKSDEDFEYTWDWFQQVREFWLRAAREGRHVIFTADQ